MCRSLSKRSTGTSTIRGIREVVVAVVGDQAEHMGQQTSLGTERVKVQVQVVDNRQNLKKSITLGIGRHRDHVPITKASRQRIHQFRCVLLQVVHTLLNPLRPSV